MNESAFPIQNRKDGGGFPTTGSIAILYSTLVLKKTDIHIAGMDFYETKYFNGTPQKNYQIKKGEVLKQFITDFIRKYKNFYFSNNRKIYSNYL